MLIEHNGSKRWRFRYRFAGKPKMISLDVYTAFTLADARARARRGVALKLVVEGNDPGEVRKDQKIALQTDSESTFEMNATARH